MKKRNESIGTCPCPVRDCNHQMQVFKFRPRPNELQRRNAGKFYADCPEHGRIGWDGKQATIDYIAEYMTWHEKPASEPESPSVSTSEESRPAPAKVPANQSPNSSHKESQRRHLWEL